MSTAIGLKIIIGVLAVGGTVAVFVIEQRAPTPAPVPPAAHVVTQQERDTLNSLTTVAPKKRGEMH